jgi:hypothetical protein
MAGVTSIDSAELWWYGDAIESECRVLGGPTCEPYRIDFGGRSGMAGEWTAWRLRVRVRWGEGAVKCGEVR